MLDSTTKPQAGAIGIRQTSRLAHSQQWDTPRGPVANSQHSKRGNRNMAKEDYRYEAMHDRLKRDASKLVDEVRRATSLAEAQRKVNLFASRNGIGGVVPGTSANDAATGHGAGDD